MADLAEQIIEAEIDFPRDFTNVVERPYGLLFYNEEIPESYDSNHARILRDDALDAAVADVRDFYRSRGLTPRVYHLSRLGAGRRLREAVETAGFVVAGADSRWFVRRLPSTIAPLAAVAVRRLSEVPPDLAAMVRRSAGERAMKVLQRRVASQAYHLLCAFADGRPVAVASLQSMGGVARVDDVLTDSSLRGKGYARAVIHHLVGYHAKVMQNTLYLYAENPTAIRIYGEAGFVEIDEQLECWSAWQEP